MNALASPTTTCLPTATVRSNSIRQTTDVVDNCVIVSSDRQRRISWAAAASAAGWHTSTHADAGNAHVAAECKAVQFAIVDLEPCETPPGFRWLCEWLMANRPRDLLLLVNGHVDCAGEESWARQLGAWAYLPGLGKPEGCERWLRDAGDVARSLRSREFEPSLGDELEYFVAMTRGALRSTAPRESNCSDLFDHPNTE